MSRFEAVDGRSTLALSGESSIHHIHTATTQLKGYFVATFDEDGQIDLSALVDGEIQMPLESLKSGNAFIDRELRNRLDIRRFPQVVAKLLEFRGKNGPERYRAVGDLTFHGTTQRLEGELIVQQVDEQTIEIQGEIDLDVRDFKVEPPSLLILKVYPAVKAKLHFVVKRANQHRE